MEASGRLVICPLLSVDEPSSLKSSFRFAASREASAITMTLPQDHGTGIIWRLNSIARYQERDGGVYVELEAIALSRDIPGGLRWLVEPIVRRVSRSSLVVSLQETADAVRSSTNIISPSLENPRCSAANCGVAATSNGTVVRSSANPLTSAVAGKGMHP